MPATSMLSFMQKALRNLLVGDDEVIPARGCSRADGIAEPTSVVAPRAARRQPQPTFRVQRSR